MVWLLLASMIAVHLEWTEYFRLNSGLNEHCIYCVLTLKLSLLCTWLWCTTRLHTLISLIPQLLGLEISTLWVQSTWKFAWAGLLEMSGSCTRSRLLNVSVFWNLYDCMNILPNAYLKERFLALADVKDSRNFGIQMLLSLWIGSNIFTRSSAYV